MSGGGLCRSPQQRQRKRTGVTWCQTDPFPPSQLPVRLQVQASCPRPLGEGCHPSRASQSLVSPPPLPIPSYSSLCNPPPPPTLKKKQNNTHKQGNNATVGMGLPTTNNPMELPALDAVEVYNAHSNPHPSLHPRPILYASLRPISRPTQTPPHHLFKRLPAHPPIA